MNKTAEKTQVLIVGGGLSGLHTAWELKKRGISFMLLEARDRLGGRILSQKFGSPDYPDGNAAFELGPSWFWPGQTRIKALVQELGLNGAVFEQTDHGLSLYEDQDNNIHRGITGASMRGSYRINGGMDRMTTELANRLSPDQYQTNSLVNNISFDNESISAQFINEDTTTKISTKFVVLALPPRLATTLIKFDPPLQASRIRDLENIATWMAGQAKVIVLYDKPFWHDNGFSGDVLSQRGPLHEIHDASPAEAGPYALFGFLGVPAQSRLGKQDELRKAVIDQLVRLFGESALSPLDIYLKDWAFDLFTSIQADQEMMCFHLSNNIQTTIESNWDNRLIWSGTESASLSDRNNGYLEGALEASERTVEYLSNLFT